MASLSALRSPRLWLPAFVAGATAGVIAYLRSRHRDGSPGASWSRVRHALGGAAGRFGGWDGEPGVGEEGIEGLRERLRALPGGAGVEVREMAEGILEMVGNVATDDQAAALLEEARSAEGVEVVVNRLWTPTSRAPLRDRRPPRAGGNGAN